MAASACREHLGRDRAVQPEPLGVPDGADVDAEPLVDVGAVAERELRAAAAGVEHDERARRPRPRPACDREVGEPALLLAGDDLDRGRPSRRSIASTTAAALRGDPQAGRADRRDRDGAGSRCASSAMPAIAATVRSSAARRDRAGLLEALAEPGDLGAVDDRVARRRPGARSATWNLIEFVPTSMTA